jgi:hypothetical protein
MKHRQQLLIAQRRVLVGLELAAQALGRLPDFVGQVVQFRLDEREGHGLIVFAPDPTKTKRATPCDVTR